MEPDTDCSKQTSSPQIELRLLDRMREVLRGMHYSYRTEQTYRYWIRYFIFWSGKRHPRDMGGREVTAFLNYLATEREVAAATQNQALSALLFLYAKVLEITAPRPGETLARAGPQGRLRRGGAAARACAQVPARRPRLGLAIRVPFRPALGGSAQRRDPQASSFSPDAVARRDAGGTRRLHCKARGLPHASPLLRDSPAAERP
jgi:hypothetical protein